MSKEESIKGIRKKLKDDYGLKISKQEAERLHRVMAHNSAVQGAVVLNLFFTISVPILYIINIPLAIAIIAHSKKLNNYEIASLAGYRVWSKIYLVLCTPLFIGLFLTIYYAVTTKAEHYAEYERIYELLHKNNKKERRISGSEGCDENVDNVESDDEF